MKNLNVKQHVERGFERVLWQMRWSVLVAAVCSVLAALCMFYISAVDTAYAVDRLLGYYQLDSMLARSVMRADAVAMVVKVIDIFLLAIVLMIFGLGIYELYISKIDHAYARHDESAKHMLSVNNLDDLKSRLGKVIVMVLIVKFFEMAISMEVDGAKDLLVFSGGILLIGATLFMTETVSRRTGQWKTRATDRISEAMGEPPVRPVAPASSARSSRRA